MDITTINITAFHDYKQNRPRELTSISIDKLTEIYDRLTAIKLGLRMERDSLVGMANTWDPASYNHAKLRAVNGALVDLDGEAKEVEKALNTQLDYESHDKVSVPKKSAADNIPKTHPKFKGAHVLNTSRTPMPSHESMYPSVVWKPPTREPIKGCTGIEAFEEYQSIRPKPRDPSEKLHTAIDWLERNTDLLQAELAELEKRGHKDTPIYVATLNTLNEVVKEKIQIEEYADTVVKGPIDDEQLARILQEELDREAPAWAKAKPPAVAPQDTKSLDSAHIDPNPKPDEYKILEMIFAIVPDHSPSLDLGRYISLDDAWRSIHRLDVAPHTDTLNLVPYLNIMLLVCNSGIDSMLIYSRQHKIVVGFRVKSEHRQPHNVVYAELIETAALVSQLYAEQVRASTHGDVIQIDLRRQNGITYKVETYATLRLESDRATPHIITSCNDITGSVPPVKI